MLLKPGSRSTEFWATAIKAGLCGLISLGVIDPQVIEFTTGAIQDVQQTVSQVNVDSSSLNGVFDTLFKMVALVVGGNVVSNYSKSRGMAKGKLKEVTKEAKEDG